MRLRFLNKFFIFVFILITLLCFNYDKVMRFFLEIPYDVDVFNSVEEVQVETKNNDIEEKIEDIKIDEKKMKDINETEIIVIHGLYGGKGDLSYVSGLFSEEGYRVTSIQYPTYDESIEEIVKKYIAPVISSIDKSKKKIIIAHSLGTVVVRAYLENHKPKNLKSVIFISPPSRGSYLADHPIAKFLDKGLGKTYAEVSIKKRSFVNRLSEPNYKCIVLIGDKSNNFLYSMMIPGKDDGMVPIDTSRMNSCEYKEIKGTTHMSILKNNTTFHEIINFANE